ncbi:MAG: hypothetical protein U0794_22965 [Isosphaeraceae bacterium]
MRRTFHPRPCWLLVAGLIILAGCTSPGDSGDHDPDHHDHAGHEIPAHKPRTFPDAIRQSRELADRVTAKAASGRAADLLSGRELSEALDVAEWLPEIAAETDMPESAWNEVDAQSRTLVTGYRTLLDQAKAGAIKPEALAHLKESVAAVATLERFLAAADPRWFGTTRTAAATP